MYLLDTDVISEVRRARPDPSVQAWFDEVDGTSLYLSTLVLGEIARGITRLQYQDPTRAAALSAWLERLRTAYRDRLLPIDAAVAEEWGRMTAHRTVPAIDGLLAATAKHHGMILVTRNTADVAELGGDVLNPF